MKIRNNNIHSESVTIDINECVSITLRKKEYNQLCELLCTDITKQMESVKFSQKMIDARNSSYITMLNDLSDIFYETREDSEIVFKRSIENISEQSIDEFLKKYSKLLGIL